MAQDSRKLCFVVGPIGAEGSPERNHADLLLEFIIKPAMKEFPDYDVVRQDKDTKPGMIDTQIIIALRDAALVIADLSHLNPNAFYEIGIRHMVEKPIIHMQLEDQRIPFDLSLYKTVSFAFTNPKTYEKARDDLCAQIKEAVAEGYEVDNPVTRALGQAKFKQTALPETKVLEGQMASMQAVIENLQQQIDAIKVPSLASLGHHPTRYENSSGTGIQQALERVMGTKGNLSEIGLTLAALGRNAGSINANSSTHNALEEYAKKQRDE